MTFMKNNLAHAPEDNTINKDGNRSLKNTYNFL